MQTRIPILRTATIVNWGLPRALTVKLYYFATALVLHNTPHYTTHCLEPLTLSGSPLRLLRPSRQCYVISNHNVVLQSRAL